MSRQDMPDRAGGSPAGSARGGLWRSVASLLLTLALVEGGLQLVYRMQHGQWRLAQPTWGAPMFSGHPYLVAVPTPSQQVTVAGTTVSHNGLGFRGPETTRAKPAGMRRVVTLGASTTYSTGVSDDETWQRYLEGRLGSGYEVLNFGVPGYTTVENLFQTAFHLTDYEPDVAIYFEGWADARTQHIAGLEGDYSGFHGRFQFTNLRLDEMRPGRRSATLFFLKGILDRLTPGLFYLSAHSEPGPGALSGAVDPRALALYRRNLGLIAALCRQQGIEPIFVPQILNRHILTSGEPYGWLPYVADRDLIELIGVYNGVMAEVAAEQGITFAAEVLEPDYRPQDFVDQGHFSATGTRAFAAALAPVVARLTPPAPPAPIAPIAAE